MAADADVAECAGEAGAGKVGVAGCG